MCAFFIVIALATSHWAIAGASIALTAVLAVVRLASGARAMRRAETPVP
jgi:hypothetical protein